MVISWYATVEGAVVECGRSTCSTRYSPCPLHIHLAHSFSEKVLPPPPIPLELDLFGCVVNFGGLFPSLIFKAEKEWGVWETFLAAGLESRSDITPPSSNNWRNEISLELCEISDFHCEVDENYTLLGCYAGGSGDSLLTFRDSLSVPSSRGKNSILDPWRWDR